MQLIFRKDKKKGGYKLNGYWQGKSRYGTCKPGKVHLTRKVPKA